MARIFISYRRDDSAGHVGWLRSLLIQRFGADQIFRDIETIPPGVDFVEAIEAAVGSCDVLLAIIGPRWLTVTDRPGYRRLDNPEDFVRIEIATALERNIRVIPVLVQDAAMPRSNELPAALAKLARRSSIELRDSSWEYDVGRLGDALKTILQSQAFANQPMKPPIQQVRADQSAQPIVQRSQTFEQDGSFLAKLAQDAKNDAQKMQPPQQIDALIAQLLQPEEQHDWDTVIEIGEQILEIDPMREAGRSKIAKAYNNRGLIRCGQGNLSGGLEDFEQALRLDPSLAFVHYNRGRVYLAKKNRAAARKDFERAAELGHEGAKEELVKMSSSRTP